MQKLQKKICLTICFAVLVAFLSISATAKQREFGQVLGKDVNLRETPSIQALKTALLPVGAEVEILEPISVKNPKTKATEKWYRVIYDGIIGYIRDDLVFVRSTKNRIAYAMKDGANVRGAPSQSAYILGKLEAGRAVKVSMMVGEWYYVVFQGDEGFVHKDLVTLSRQAGGTGSEQLLKFDMSGKEVKKMQEELSRRNFLSDKNITGTFGAQTRDAVVEFQKAAKLESADGVAGPSTIKMLYDKTNGIRKAPKIPQKPADFKNKVIMADWWKGGNRVLQRPGGIATLTDIATGRSFRIRRTGGTNHNDVVPLTAADTAILKGIVGRFSWARRAVWVRVGSTVYAGSINTMPHSPDPQKSDNYPGHFCLHFLNSRTHGGNRLDPDHQGMVRYAFNKAK